MRDEKMIVVEVNFLEIEIFKDNKLYCFFSLKFLFLIFFCGENVRNFFFKY